MNTLIVVMVALLALVAACTQEIETPVASGIDGQILLGPICPVEREGMPCERPYKANVVVWNAARTQKVLTLSADDEGRFHVSLAPGDYYLDPQSGGEVLPRPIPQTVTVPEGQFASITIRFDTGIR